MNRGRENVKRARGGVTGMEKTVGKRKRRAVKSKDRALLMMAMPAIIKIFIFSYLPMIGIVIAFKNYYPIKGIFASPWNGLKNFEFFFVSADAWRILRNTIGLNLLMIVTGPVVHITAALLLYTITKPAALKIYQSILFVPHFFSWVLVGLLLTTLLDYPNGLVTKLLASLGLDVNLYGTPAAWVGIIPMVSIWKSTGFKSLIYYAVLMNISPDLFEAARIDGANEMQVVRHISLPHIVPMLIVQLILAVGGIIRGDFGLFYYVPRNLGVLYPVTEVIDTYVFKALTTNGDFGMSAAVGLFQSVVGCAMILLTNKLASSVDSSLGLF